MDPIFTLPYSEYAVAQLLTKHLKKTDGYRIAMPLSRRELALRAMPVGIAKGALHLSAAEILRHALQFGD